MLSFNIPIEIFNNISESLNNNQYTLKRKANV